MGCLHCDKIFQELVEFPDLGGQPTEAEIVGVSTEPEEYSATVIDKKKKRKK
jgi:hypothetical protein